MGPLKLIRRLTTKPGQAGSISNDSIVAEPPDQAESTKTARSLSLTTFSSVSIFPRAPAKTSIDDPTGPMGLSLLYSPPEPKIDFIFVHGLGGGSRKTWSRRPEVVGNFWPADWLPKDPDFQNVRIYSFGYDARYWKNDRDYNNLNEFGKSLLGEISTVPGISTSKTPIVAIGHSMGGLVIKNAWLIAQQGSSYKTITNRFAAFYFLAVPQKGSDSAKILDSIPFISRDHKYIRDLVPDSQAIRSINDQFRHVPNHIELWSFYETKATDITHSLIVHPSFAVLGLPNELQRPLQADHRSICKFKDTSDANYRAIRNALATTTRNISELVAKSTRSGKKDLEQKIVEYLKVDQTFYNDLEVAQEGRFQGSCHWVLKKDEFRKWRSSRNPPDRTLWIDAKPGTGKSTLSSFIVDSFQHDNVPCSYYFFKASENSRSRFASCLCALAFQMAVGSERVRDALAEMMDNHVTFSYDEPRSIWRTVFVDTIFKTQMAEHYWILDGIDECVDEPVLRELILVKLDGSIPLKLLITSRDAPNPNPINSQSVNQILRMSISTSDTSSDLQSMVKEIASSFVAVNKKERELLVQLILKKSCGSFLWTRLVLEELQKTHTKSEIDQALKEVPNEMRPLYQRTLDTLSGLGRRKGRIHELLTWAACCMRPMTTSQVKSAISLATNEDVPNINNVIESECGQLLTIDKNDNIRMVHETAREFLTDPGLKSEFAVSPLKAHTLIAERCLMYLVGDDLSLWRSARKGSVITMSVSKDTFDQYAIECFSHHLARADPDSEQLFSLLKRFLDDNILSWIRLVANSGDLTLLAQASKHLNTYASAFSSRRSLKNNGVEPLIGWSFDLMRLTAKFHHALITFPASIYSIVAPLCPATSMIRKAGKKVRGLPAKGTIGEEWDDKLACIGVAQGQATAVRFGDGLMAIGFSSGALIVYSTMAYQEYITFNHGESVNIVRFQPKRGIIVSCGYRMTKVWDTKDGTLKHTFTTRHRVLDAAFDGDKLLVATAGNYISSWVLADTAIQGPDSFWNDSCAPAVTPLQRSVCALDLSPSQELLAVAYNGYPILLWDLRANAYYGTCGKTLTNGKTSTHVVVDLVFNSNPDPCLLVVAYLDGDLALLNPLLNTELVCFRANFRTLSASLDGRFLAAAGDEEGTVHIYEFYRETLRPLYKARSPGTSVKKLALSTDGRYLADLRASQCAVWEPPLMHDYAGEHGTGTGTGYLAPVEHVSTGSEISVVSIAGNAPGDHLFCGKDDGSVSLYNRQSAEFVQGLYNHTAPVTRMVWSASNEILLTVDSWNNIIGYRFAASGPGHIGERVVESKLDQTLAIVELFVIEDGSGRFITSTRESDHLWNASGELLESRVDGVSTVRRWMSHPLSNSHIVRIDTAEVRVYRQDNWSEVSRTALPLPGYGLQGCEPGILVHLLTPDGPRTLLQLSDHNGARTPRGLVALKFQPVRVAEDAVVDGGISANEGNHMISLSIPVKKISLVLGGTEQGELLYIDSDSWVCSARISDDADLSLRSELPGYTRHFFLPHDWFSGVRGFTSTVIQRHGDIVVGRNNGVVVIQGWKEYAVPLHLPKIATTG